MRIWFLALALCLSGSLLRAEAMQVGGNVTGTARVAGLTVPLDQILVTPKADYVHIIWDAFAERDAIRREGKSFSLAAAVLALVQGPGLAASPKAALFKVDVAEFPVRDDYGAPLWDKMDFLGRYVASLDHGKWLVKKRADD